MESILVNIAMSLLTGIVTGAVSTVAVIAVIKNDIKWLKESNARAHQRIDRIEDRRL